MKTRRRSGEFFRDQERSSSGPHSVVQLSMTPARWDFMAARHDAITLITLYDEKTKRKPGKPDPQLEALKRSSIILSVTAWESFVEDTIRERVEDKLKTAENPASVISLFNTVASQWLQTRPQDPKDLLKWTGTGWKQRLQASLENKLQHFHNPSSERVIDLFKKYCGVNISHFWRWRGVSPSKACGLLDALIVLRGRVTHVGRTFFPGSKTFPEVSRKSAVDAINLIYMLVDSTEVGLDIHPKEKELSV